MKYLFFILLIFATLNCRHNVAPLVIYPSFLNPSKDNLWGADVRLSIVNKVTTEKYALYTLKSYYNRDTLGFQLLLPFYEDSRGFGAGSQLISLGKISKNFKNSLAVLYGLKTDTSQAFPNKIICSFADIDKFVRNLTGKETIEKPGFKDYKLFFEDSKESEEGEAEIYLNINESAKIVELVEKDKDYRKLLIGLISQNK